MKKISFLGFMLVLLLLSCKKDNEISQNEDNQKEKIQKIIPEKYLYVLKKLGMTIHEGNNPPDITGIYLVSPSVVLNTNIENDHPIGYILPDNRCRFYDQNGNDFSIKTAYINGTNKGESKNSAISGSGKSFTVYSLINVASGDASVIFAYLYSGILEENGIKDFKWALINVDNSNGADNFINEGEGRLIEDNDHISERINSLDATTNVYTELHNRIADLKKISN